MGTWTHSICQPCWTKREPNRVAVKVREAEPEPCCFCGATTDTGIYLRCDPRSPALRCAPRRAMKNDHYDLGVADAKADNARYTFQDPQLQEWYDAGYYSVRKPRLVIYPPPQRTRRWGDDD